MKRLLLIGVFATGLIGRASAGGFERIDFNKRADVTGQIVEFPTLNFDAIPAATTRTQTISPVSGQRVDRSQTVATKLVETKTVNFGTREYTVRSYNTVAQKNFTTKQAVLEQPAIASPSVTTAPAKVKSRIIRPYTPAGERELQDQINRIP